MGLPPFSYLSFHIFYFSIVYHVFFKVYGHCLFIDVIKIDYNYLVEHFENGYIPFKLLLF